MEKSSSMDEYCKSRIDNDFCKRINQYVTSNFCKVACKGDVPRFYSPPLDELRAKYRPELSEKEKLDKDVISVIIPTCKADEQYLERTLASLRENAIGPLEVLIERDKDDEGLRVMMNRAAKKSTGKYLMKIDAHCAMSPEWDARMKASCREDTIIKPMIDTLDLETWRGTGRDMGPISLNAEMRNQHLTVWKPLQDRKIEEESLCFLGCCYIMEKQYYEKHGGCDETLGKWGALGLEWSFKTWLTGGRVLIRTDTVCCHYFRFDKPFDIKDEEVDNNYRRLGIKWRDGLGEGQTKPLPWLCNKFANELNANMRVATRDQRTPARYAT